MLDFASQRQKSYRFWKDWEAVTCHNIEAIIVQTTNCPLPWWVKQWEDYLESSTIITRLKLPMCLIRTACWIAKQLWKPPPLTLLRHQNWRSCVCNFCNFVKPVIRHYIHQTLWIIHLLTGTNQKAKTDESAISDTVIISINIGQILTKYNLIIGKVTGLPKLCQFILNVFIRFYGNSSFHSKPHVNLMVALVKSQGIASP